MISKYGLALDKLHPIAGFATSICVILLGIGGMVAGASKVLMEWKTKTLLTLGLIHKSFGYLIILGTQFCLFTGFLVYGNN
jgi:hypothetical protein